jgi:hypothetical protein
MVDLERDRWGRTVGESQASDVRSLRVALGLEPLRGQDPVESVPDRDDELPEAAPLGAVATAALPVNGLTRQLQPPAGVLGRSARRRRWGPERWSHPRRPIWC